MEPTVTQLEPARVAFIRHTGPYSEVGPIWERLAGWAGQKGLFGQTTEMFGLAYDDPDTTPVEEIRYDACVTVGPEVEADGEIGVKEISAGRYATTTLLGSYEGLAQVYDALLGWISSQDLSPTMERPCREYYRNSPRDTPEDELRTDVFIPLSS